MPSRVLEFHSGAPKGAASSRALPKAWPQEIIYLTSPKYSKNVNYDTLHIGKALQGASLIPVIGPRAQAPSLLVRVKSISSASHPANGQRGLFATQSLPPDTFILNYLGFFHAAIDADPKSDYDLGLDAELGIAVDASGMGNESRFINDYRGVSNSGPNAEFRDVLVDFGNGALERCMAVFVLRAGKVKSGKRARGIAKGEEILVSYGKGFWNGRKREGALGGLADVT